MVILLGEFEASCEIALLKCFQNHDLSSPHENPPFNLLRRLAILGIRSLYPCGQILGGWGQGSGFLYLR